MIPEWLDNNAANAPAPQAHWRKNPSFLERTLRDTALFVEKTLFSEQIANRDGLLQRFSPAGKLPAFLMLIVTVSLLHAPGVIWSLYLGTLLLAYFSCIEPLFFIKRVWLFIPVFAAMIAVPALFNLVVPGEPLWVLAHFERPRQIGPYLMPDTIAITRQGLLSAVTFVGRVAVSVSLALLLTLTTRWNALFQALASVRVPQLFIMILAMTYRYILLLVRTVTELHIARKSRTIRYLKTRQEQRWVASRMGYLFSKSYRLSQDVHSAMLSRGYSGAVKTMATQRATRADYCRLLVCIGAAIIILVFDRNGAVQWGQ